MGTYLSTPVTDKASEKGEALECEDVPCRWAVVDMQGWRKSMEDAHVVNTDICSDDGVTIKNAKLFGVFDGHGGPEVARFCQLYMVSVLKHQQELWSKTPDTCGELMGPALVETFHGLDRMIDDPSRRDELIRLRSVKPPPSERRPVEEIPPSGGGIGLAAVVLQQQQAQSHINTQQSQSIVPPPPPPPREKQNSNDENTPDKATAAEDPASSASGESSDASPNEEREDANNSNGDATNDTTNDEIKKDKEVTAGDEGYDSDEAVGKEEAAAEREQEEENNDVEINPYDGDKDGEESKDEADADSDNSSQGKVSFMFQRLLNMSSPSSSGQVVIRVGANGEEEEKPNNVEANDPASATPMLTHSPGAPMMGPSVLRPTLVQNGRLICNLPDHPIHAGCTAVVAFLIGKTLTVANAGDSRAVLCRAGGRTEPLSFDHKPQQMREMNRIKNAGGFVNQFGRVNGNLNLSRSIGDLKYKQVPHCSPAEQMITAEPDIVQVTLEPEDEFLILGCDGIWDCLTNERAVEYVRERIDTKEPKAIGEEMLDEIISDDPKATQGIGGDNMTVMIIDLQPKTRSYNNPGETKEDGASAESIQESSPSDDVAAATSENNDNNINKNEIV